MLASVKPNSIQLDTCVFKQMTLMGAIQDLNMIDLPHQASGM